mmetsp:Transcript_10409/g.18362  ORF Transcript_10409/g.18362 Transcript_10409/m.18362 type:complete len:133 (-) Transcript_10409:146-544(-)
MGCKLRVGGSSRADDQPRDGKAEGQGIGTEWAGSVAEKELSRSIPNGGVSGSQQEAAGASIARVVGWGDCKGNAMALAQGRWETGTHPSRNLKPPSPSQDRAWTRSGPSLDLVWNPPGYLSQKLGEAGGQRN